MCEIWDAIDPDMPDRDDDIIKSPRLPQLHDYTDDRADCAQYNLDMMEYSAQERIYVRRGDALMQMQQIFWSTITSELLIPTLGLRSVRQQLRVLCETVKPKGQRPHRLYREEYRRAMKRYWLDYRL